MTSRLIQKQRKSKNFLKRERKNKAQTTVIPVLAFLSVCVDSRACIRLIKGTPAFIFI